MTDIASNTLPSTPPGIVRHVTAGQSVTAVQVNFQSVVDRLKEALGRFRRSRLECGRLLSEFQASAPESSRTKAVRKLAKAVGISQRTAFNYIELYRKTAMLEQDLVSKAAESGLDMDVPGKVRFLAEAKSKSPEIDNDALIELAKQAIAQQRRRRTAHTKEGSEDIVATVAKASTDNSEARIERALATIRQAFEGLLDHEDIVAIEKLAKRLFAEHSK